MPCWMPRHSGSTDGPHPQPLSVPRERGARYEAEGGGDGGGEFGDERGLPADRRAVEGRGNRDPGRRDRVGAAGGRLSGEGGGTAGELHLGFDRGPRRAGEADRGPPAVRRDGRGRARDAHVRPQPRLLRAPGRADLAPAEGWLEATGARFGPAGARGSAAGGPGGRGGRLRLPDDGLAGRPAGGGARLRRHLRPARPGDVPQAAGRGAGDRGGRARSPT